MAGQESRKARSPINLPPIRTYRIYFDVSVMKRTSAVTRTFLHCRVHRHSRQLGMETNTILVPLAVLYGSWSRSRTSRRTLLRRRYRQKGAKRKKSVCITGCRSGCAFNGFFRSVGAGYVNLETESILTRTSTPPLITHPINSNLVVATALNPYRVISPSTRRWVRLSTATATSPGHSNDTSIIL
ncbi:hypothetical protein JOM56_007894 [Amanita muscaria]